MDDSLGYHDANDAEVARISSLLKTAIRLAGHSAREVERRLGLSGGYMSRMFSGGIELKVRHVLDISEVIQLDPGEFFDLALPTAPQLASPTAKRLYDLVCRIRGTPPPAPPQPLTNMNAEQLQEMMRGAVRELFAELGRAGR